jgi:hypothetical protein
MLRCQEIEFLSLSASCVAASSICAAPFSNMCSTQADNNSLKSRLRCGCQFPWCAFGLRAVSARLTDSAAISEYRKLEVLLEDIDLRVVWLQRREVGEYVMGDWWITIHQRTLLHWVPKILLQHWTSVKFSVVFCPYRWNMAIGRVKTKVEKSGGWCTVVGFILVTRVMRIVPQWFQFILCSHRKLCS